MVTSSHKQYAVGTIDDITLIGCGGTGSFLAEHLARMIAGFRLACGLTLIDGDTVGRDNLWRQNFAASEIGINKAEALALRLSARFGLGVRFVGSYVSTRSTLNVSARGQLVITATDSLISRRAVAMQAPSLWIDVGNDKLFGQARIGTTAKISKLRTCYRRWAKDVGYVGDLPNEAILNPKLLKATRKPARRIGCGQMPFDEQGFGINAMAAMAAAMLARQAVVDGVVTAAAIYFETETGKMTPRLIDRDVFAAWR